MIKTLLIATLLSIALIANGQALDEATKLNLGILNYALTLEHLEATFYRQGLQTFTAQNAIAAGLTENDYKLLGDIRDHEATHVTTLQSVLQSLGATAVQECSYNFGYGNDFNAFLTVAAALENTGVSAYDGAIASISVPALVTASATIATVEARHAAYLNKLVNTNPFPLAFDVPKNVSEILAIATPFIVSCPEGNGACSGQSGASACSQNGQCLFGYCVCAKGFTGNNCEVAATSPSTAAPSTVAPTTAAPTNSEASPTCQANVSGPNVASPARSVKQTQSCNGQGTCNASNICVCNAGYSGRDCEVAPTTNAPGENISGDNNAKAAMNSAVREIVAGAAVIIAAAAML